MLLRRLPRAAGRLLSAGLLAAPCLARAAEAAPDTRALLRDWEALNGACRGGRGDDPGTLEACARRDAVDRQLAAAGWCYGRPGDAGYQRAWQLCAVRDRR
ncbi:hypothetical protein [Methylobacterium dankookense]|uniref:Lysozyme inhibitor LprI N-terminal domain-containing protein n=1 Tax=Methylobacterium dankookense TaxID=560405 RepID=A0A564FYW7_9HYPH|nr:hypothetical protein [Methylobacterium dankookense]GJD58501.1 hypothetical protein IFDJLNFL_4422 [Methylobacterium dankookense]VUF13182.1 hypothetical protein MTDSW087_02881 [Methylobacterium dankookense]